jgi:hypothetical protein
MLAVEAPTKTTPLTAVALVCVDSTSFGDPTSFWGNDLRGALPHVEIF